MSNEQKLNLIVATLPPAVAKAAELQDRLGGETHGNAEIISLNLSGFRAEPVDSSFLDKLEEPIDKAMTAIQKKFQGFSLEEITISLAVTAEGHIGIATAGVESSIEVTFRKK